MGLDTLDETKPLDTDPVSFGDDEIRLTRAATKQSFGLEHWLSGEHKYIVGTSSARPAAGKRGRLFVNSSNNTIEYDNGSAWIATGATLVSGSVGPNELANGAVTNVKLADNSITSAKIVDGTITAVDIADGTITAAKLQPGAIAGSYIADKSIDANAKIVDGSIRGAQIADGTIAGTKIQDNSITAADIFPGQAMYTIGGQSRTDIVSFSSTLNTHIVYLDFTWASRGGNVLVLAVVHCVHGIDSGGTAQLIGNIWQDGTPGTPNGTLLTRQYIEGNTAQAVVLTPATIMMFSRITPGAGTHRIKVSAYLQNRYVGNPRILSGWSYAVELA